MWRSMRVLTVLFLAFAACPAPKSDYVEPPDPPLNLNLFPVVAGSSKLFADIGDARLEFDPTTRDAISALGSCVDAVSYCYSPGVKEVGWCLEHTRPCATETPWTEKACCPVACKDAFNVAVDAGVAPSAAIEQVFFIDKVCFPGLTAALEGTP
jgi:hypothetical protein